MSAEVNTLPRIFVSYSHDSQQHKDWVLQLATRLVNNGVNVILDQWDITLGGDLPRFMENGLKVADRVLAVCTEQYVIKASSSQGGVAFEKMILTAQLMHDIDSDRIIPLVRDGSSEALTPLFLSSRLYIDFRDASTYESKYAELIRDIHGQQISPRPPLGVNPFNVVAPAFEPTISFSDDRYMSPATSGRVTFDYSNNNGRYAVGAGDMLFETRWSRGSNTAIHAYNDITILRSVSIASDVRRIEDIKDARIYDTSSTSRSPMLGEIVIWQNSQGYFLATKVEELKSRGHGSVADEIVFSYVIAPNKSPAFG